MRKQIALPNYNIENKDSVIDFNKSIELDPDPQEDLSYFLRGQQLFKLGRIEDAILDYIQAIEINPTFPDSYLQRGDAFQQLERMEDSIIDFIKSIELDQHKDLQYLLRGQSLLKLERRQDAIINFIKAIEINPKFSDSYVKRGIILNYLKREQEAIIDFTKSIEIDLNLLDGYYNRGLAFNYLGRVQDAIFDFTEVIQIKPNANSYYQGELKKQNYLDLNIPQLITLELSRSIQHLLMLIQINPVGVQLKRTEQSLLDYTKAIEINPHNCEAYTLRELHIRNQAERRMPLMNKQNKKMYSYRSIICYALKTSRSEEATIDYNNALKINPKNAEIYYLRGLAFEQLERLQDALNDYTKALEIDRNYLDAFFKRMTRNINWAFILYQKFILDRKINIDIIKQAQQSINQQNKLLIRSQLLVLSDIIQLFI